MIREAGSEESLEVDELLVPSGIYDYGNGEYYYIAAVAVPKEFCDLVRYVGVKFTSDVPAKYELFAFYVTEKTIERWGL